MCQLFINVKGHFHGNGCDYARSQLRVTFRYFHSWFPTFVYYDRFVDFYDMSGKVKLRVTNLCFVAFQITMNAYQAIMVVSMCATTSWEVPTAHAKLDMH